MVLSIDSAIITVSDGGGLRRCSDGVTTVIVSNGSLQSSISGSVEVRNIGDLVFKYGLEP